MERPDDGGAPTVRVVAGTGSGPTALSSYDAALAEAGVHDYNIVTVSSILPPESTVEVAGTAPDLGPPGSRLTVVEARSTVAGPGRAVAGLGWITGEGAGVVYEAEGSEDSTVRAELREGLAAAAALRERSFDDERVEVTATDAGAGEYATAVVLAIYGRGEAVT